MLTFTNAPSKYLITELLWYFTWRQKNVLVITEKLYFQIIQIFICVFWNLLTIQVNMFGNLFIHMEIEMYAELKIIYCEEKSVMSQYSNFLQKFKHRNFYKREFIGMFWLHTHSKKSTTSCENEWNSQHERNINSAE